MNIILAAVRTLNLTCLALLVFHLHHMIYLANVRMEIKACTLVYGKIDINAVREPWKPGRLV
jgi:hypothetical protein